MSLKRFAFLSSLFLITATSQAEGLTGDAAAGQKKNATCIGCHGIVGYQASFPEVYKVPKISQQNAKYIADLAAYYEQHGKKVDVAEQAITPPAVVAELLTKGGCAGCHGANFSKPMDPSYPKLAGQHRDYLYIALKSYQEQGHSTWGRANAIMSGMAKPYTRAELKKIADYLGSLPGELQAVPQSKFR
jgi:cytochrome c553